jgi:DNA topoisomerase IB
MLVAEALRATGAAKTKRQAEKNVVAAVDKTAKMLGNTRSVCRKYYIHPVLIEAYLKGSVLPPQPPHNWSPRESEPWGGASDGPRLRRHEAEVLAFIRARLKQKAAPTQNADLDESELEPAVA